MNEPPLTIKNLQKSFTQGSEKINVLNNLNLEVHPSQTCAIVGQSGSGKSSLLSLLAGLDYSDSGTIAIKNKIINSMDEKAVTKFRAEHIGIIFQQYHLISSLTALENVMLPLELKKAPDPLKSAKEYLNKVGLSHRLNHLPSQLSGGECQRVAIARALCVQPTILLADEPSGSLDPQTGSEVMDLLFELIKENRGTLILVTHDHDLAKKCDRILNLENGKLVEESL